MRQTQYHQALTTNPIKFSFSCFDAGDYRPTSYPSLTITGSHDTSNSSDQSFNKSLRLSPTKLQAKRKKQICGTDFLIGSSGKRENEGISNVNLPYRIPTLNSEIKSSTYKSADKILSERQNVLGEPASKKKKILDMPDWIGIGMNKPSPMNCASSAGNNYNDCGLLYDIGQYATNDHFIALSSKKNVDQKVVNNRLIKNSTPISNCNEFLTSIDSNLMQERNIQNPIASLENLPKTSSDYALVENNNSQWRHLSIHGQPRDHQFVVNKVEPSFLEKSQTKNSSSRLSFNSSLIRNENKYSTSNIDGVFTTETFLNKKIRQAIPYKASTRPDVFFASSTACLKHPIPLSSKISCLLKAKSTNEVDKDNKVAGLDLSSTQINFLDKKLTPLSSDLNQKIYDHQKSLNSKNTSIQYFSQNKDSHRSNFKMQLEGYDQEPKMKNEEVSSVFQPKSNLVSSSSIAIPEIEYTPTSELKPTYNKLTKNFRLKEMQTHQQSNRFSSTCQEGFKTNRKDLDEVWKDFVFGAYLYEPTQI
ncbi:hypothetical protein EPUL_002283 [Erysiphe pulchra]|uniref:Uncharacterized protein n=1 Tax=Erysiphe pulchra TaxID=225359 RepID=A0A2S4PTP2_9PEZI|nr:hypothetical protein EPUL_002283 [Erysiphe pulchra]